MTLGLGILAPGDVGSASWLQGDVRSRIGILAQGDVGLGILAQVTLTRHPGSRWLLDSASWLKVTVGLGTPGSRWALDSASWLKVTLELGILAQGDVGLGILAQGDVGLGILAQVDVGLGILAQGDVGLASWLKVTLDSASWLKGFCKGTEIDAPTKLLRPINRLSVGRECAFLMSSAKKKLHLEYCLIPVISLSENIL